MTATVELMTYLNLRSEVADHELVTDIYLPLR
jgi:DNA gyrase inhibitor GyrI